MKRIHEMDQYYLARIMDMLYEARFSPCFEELGLPQKTKREINYPLLQIRMEAEVDEYRARLVKDEVCTPQRAAALSSAMLALVKYQVSHMEETDYLVIFIFKMCCEMHFASPDNQEFENVYRELRAVLLQKKYAPELIAKWEDKIKELLAKAKETKKTEETE